MTAQIIQLSDHLESKARTEIAEMLWTQSETLAFREAYLAVLEALVPIVEDRT